MKKSPTPNLSVGDFKPESYFFYIGDAGYIKRHHCNITNGRQSQNLVNSSPSI